MRGCASLHGAAKARARHRFGPLSGADRDPSRGSAPLAVRSAFRLPSVPVGRRQCGRAWRRSPRPRKRPWRTTRRAGSRARGDPPPRDRRPDRLPQRRRSAAGERTPAEACRDGPPADMTGKRPRALPTDPQCTVTPPPGCPTNRGHLASSPAGSAASLPATATVPGKRAGRCRRHEIPYSADRLHQPRRPDFPAGSSPLSRSDGGGMVCAALSWATAGAAGSAATGA